MSEKTISTVTIDSRFRGPIDSANGGYTCGILAKSLLADMPDNGMGQAVTVMLKSPPPLDTEMQIQSEGDAATLLFGEDVVGIANLAELELDAPMPPSSDKVDAVSANYQALNNPQVNECFVCGPGRIHGDGLCIYPAPFDDTNQVVDRWLPDVSLDDGEGNVATEFLWAALDCPGYFARRQFDTVALLGSITGVVLEQTKVEQPLISLGWQISVDGRKYYAGTALFDESNKLIAKSAQIWIELKKD